MKKFIFSFLFLVVSFASANEIQVFSSISNKIELDQNTKFEVIYSGKYKEYAKNQQSIFQKYFADQKSLGTQAVYTAGLIGISATALTKSGFSANGAGQSIVAALAFAGVAMIGEAIYNGIISDNEYTVIRFAINSKNETALVFSHVVANNWLNDEELLTLASEHQNKKFKGN